MSKNSTSNFNNNGLYLGISECSYAREILKITELLPLFTSITTNVINGSWYIVGDVTSSSGIYFYCGLTPAHVLHLIFSYLFCLISFIKCKTSLLCWTGRVSESISPMMVMSCRYLHFFSIYTTDHCLNIYIPLFACI